MKISNTDNVVYYFGANNLNYNAIETILKYDYQLIFIKDQNITDFPINPDSSVVAIVIDIDVTYEWDKKVEFIQKATQSKPPVIALTNNNEINPKDVPLVTDLIKFINVMQVKNQVMILKNKIDWYKDQLRAMSMQASLTNNTSINREKIISQKLKDALLNDKIYLVYHPMVNLKENTFDSFEVMIKWEDSPVADITSEEIVNAAEECGVLDAVTVWVIQKVCAFQNHLKTNNGKYYNFEIDLSINQIMSDLFFDKLQEAIDQYQVPPHCFSFEISSEILNKPLFRINKIADKVNEIGVKLSIDCVTETNISLAKVSALPTSHLKVNTMHLNEQFELLSKMAHEMGLKLIAKNVEADENQGFFENGQIDYAQDLCLHQRFENSSLFKDLLKDKEKQR